MNFKHIYNLLTVISGKIFEHKLKKDVTGSRFLYFLTSSVIYLFIYHSIVTIKYVICTFT